MTRLTAALFLLMVACASRTTAQAEFTGGLSAGPVTSQISGDGLGGWDKFGVAGGAWVHMGFSERMGLLMGLQYIQKGSRTQRDTLTFQTFAFRLNYIDVPVMATYRTGDWQFNLGLYAGVLIKQQVEANGNFDDPNPLFENRDIGGTGGVVYRFPSRWSIELRGQTSILPTRPSPSFANPLNYYERGNYNQVLQFLLHYQF